MKCRAVLVFALVWVARAQDRAVQNPDNPPQAGIAVPGLLDQNDADPAGSTESARSGETTTASPARTPSGESESQPQPYGGPGVLSRGYTTEPFDTKALRFRPYVRIAGFAGNDLAGLSGGSSVGINQGSSFGTEASFGLTGRKLLTFDSFELDLQGDALHYAGYGGYTSTNSTARLGYQHRFSSRTTLELEENYGQYSANSAYLNPSINTGIGSTSLIVSPNTLAMDARVLYLSTAGDVRYEKSPRLSFDFGGTGFETRQIGSALYGVIGAQARLDTVYRLTRRTNVGMYYSFTNYAFANQFGGSGIHTAGLIYSYDVTRFVRFRLRAGGSRIETQSLQTVTLDPVIASVLGTGTGVIAVYSRNYLPDLTAEVERRMRRGTATLTFNHGVSPGNGIVLTSTRNTASLYYDFNGFRRYNLSFGATYDALNSLGLQLGTVKTAYFTTGMRRVLSRGFQSDLRLDLRRYESQVAPFRLNTYRVSLGVDWTPGERPLSLR